MLDPATLARLRGQLPAAERCVYLNAGTFGPLPTPTRDAMHAHLRDAHEEGRIGGRGLGRTFEPMRLAREAFAVASRAEADDLALTSSTTDGLNLVLGGLDWAPGDEVLTSDAEHFGLTVPLSELARRRGVVVRALPLAHALDPVALVAAATTPRTRLLAVSHVLWTTGRVFPVKALADLARASGALTLVDGAQSVGAIEVDVPATGADFYTMSGQKWLLGPSGTGALYVRRSVRDSLAPACSGYPTMDLRNPHAPTLWPTARRFDMPALNLTALAGVAASIAWRTALGWSQTYAHAASLARRLRTRLASTSSVALADTCGAHSTLVTFEVAGHSPDAVALTLEGQKVFVRGIPGTKWVRVAVGFWNDDADLERLMAGLAGVGR